MSTQGRALGSGPGAGRRRHRARADHRTDTHDDIDPDWFQKLTQKARPTATIPTRSRYDDEPPF